MDPWPLWVCDLSKRGSYEVPLSAGADAWDAWDESAVLLLGFFHGESDHWDPLGSELSWRWVLVKCGEKELHIHLKDSTSTTKLIGEIFHGISSHLQPSNGRFIRASGMI